MSSLNKKREKWLIKWLECIACVLVLAVGSKPREINSSESE